VKLALPELFAPSPALLAELTVTATLYDATLAHVPQVRVNVAVPACEAVTVWIPDESL
jgi:hypothetical protein